MGAATLHIVKDMVPVYTVEKPEVYPQAKKVFDRRFVLQSHNGS